MRSNRSPRLSAAVAAALVLGGCTSSVTTQSDRQLVAHHTVTVTDADSGGTVRLAVGDRLVVKLGSTYWTFTAPVPDGVVQAGPVSIRPAKCAPGMGCGTASETFVAMARGRVVVAAGRDSCGEALRCTGSAGTFRLTLVVS